MSRRLLLVPNMAGASHWDVALPAGGSHVKILARWAAPAAPPSPTGFAGFGVQFNGDTDPAHYPESGPAIGGNATPWMPLNPPGYEDADLLFYRQSSPHAMSVYSATWTPAVPAPCATLRIASLVDDGAGNLVEQAATAGVLEVWEVAA